MFDFNSITRLFKYDFSDIFERTIPKDNKEKMDKKTYEDILSGAILKCVAGVFQIIVTIIIASILSGLANSFFGDINAFGIEDHIDFSVSFPITISLAILVYVIAMKDKEQSSLLPFVVLVYTAINTLRLGFSVITCFATFFLSPIAAIFSLFSVAVNLFGNAFIIVGCLDFCCKTKSAYKKAHTVIPPEQPIKTAPIDVNDVSIHYSTNCSKCGTELKDSDKFCKYCGNKIK